ncbi:unnamed protein product [Paramecium octaurelia]|uniref:Reverse transcriptase domain-containing protein n=1 Tax=Paramecium octaurelia TaxID=43137 RepID=A0A8S1XT98_PAROT|nr:unnamed protein product [Paramecium octaurelia]
MEFKNFCCQQEVRVGKIMSIIQMSPRNTHQNLIQAIRYNVHLVKVFLNFTFTINYRVTLKLKYSSLKLVSYQDQAPNQIYSQYQAELNKPLSAIIYACYQLNSQVLITLSIGVDYMVYYWKVDYLAAIHNRIIYVNAYNINNKIQFKNGVPQSSPISSALFNIYLDEFIKELLKASGNSFKLLGYVDDLILLTEHHNFGFLISKLKRLSISWNLQINNRKSGIMPIKEQLKLTLYVNYLLYIIINTLGQRLTQKDLYQFI